MFKGSSTKLNSTTLVPSDISSLILLQKHWNRALIYEIRSNIRIVFVKTASRFSLFQLIFRHYGRIWISFIYPEALMDSLKFWWLADYIYDKLHSQMPSLPARSNADVGNRYNSLCDWLYFCRTNLP